eukprot:COSAG05_NODE_1787_length_4092_cov_1.788380_3_plen_99_part_00
MIGTTHRTTEEAGAEGGAGPGIEERKDSARETAAGGARENVLVARNDGVEEALMRQTRDREAVETRNRLMVHCHPHCVVIVIVVVVVNVGFAGKHSTE